MQKGNLRAAARIADTLEGVEGIVPELFDGAGLHGEPCAAAWRVFKIDNVLILACGTSYYSGCTAKYWLEDIAGIPTQVEAEWPANTATAPACPTRTWSSPSAKAGETADTLAALRHAQSLGMHHTLTICNVATSAMVRRCKLAYITRAGVEIGVASRPRPSPRSSRACSC